MIYDIAQIKKFQNLFLNNHIVNESAILYVAARKKYDKSLISNIGLMNRTLVTKDDGDLSCHIKDKLDKDYYENSGKTINKNALAVYMCINPRNTKEAAANLAKYIITALMKNSTNLHLIPSEFRTIVQQTLSRKLYTVLDVDSKLVYPNVMEELKKYEIQPCCIIETRGGYHVILNHKDLDRIKRFSCECPKQPRCEHVMTFGEYLHKIMLKWTDKDDADKAVVECAKDPFSPIPGTMQGGFPVKMIYP